MGLEVSGVEWQSVRLWDILACFGAFWAICMVGAFIFFGIAYFFNPSFLVWEERECDCDD